MYKKKISKPEQNRAQPSVKYHTMFLFSFFVFVFGFVLFFFLFRATPTPYGSPQATGAIGAAAARLYHSHSNARSKPNL